MNGTMMYCPPGVSISDIWIDHGLSKCFIETVSASSMFLFLLIFGSWRLFRISEIDLIHWRYLHSSSLYNFQVSLHLFVPILAIIRFVLQITVLDDRHAYGYMILSVTLICLTYPYALIILTKERSNVPFLNRGHSLALLTFWTFAFVFENLSFMNFGQKKWWFHLDSQSDIIEMVLFVVRYIMNLLLFVIGLKAPGMNYWDNDDADPEVNLIPPTTEGSTFRNAWRKICKLAPFIWPRGSVPLQISIFICGVIVILGRVMNVFVPIYTGKLLDSMTLVPLEFRWDLVVIFVALKFLQGGGVGVAGLLNIIRTFLWIPISQYTSREMEIEVFTHLQYLSLRWHLNRKSGEVIKIMSRGTDSITSLLSNILFSIAPVLVDILVAVIYFFSTFNIWFGVIVFVTMFIYLGLTIAITEWRTKFIRKMNLATNHVTGQAVDSLLNYETVKYFNAEQFEKWKYTGLIKDFQKEEWKSLISLSFLNFIQNFIITGGLLIGSLLCVYMVTIDRTLTVGDYGLFSSYLLQLFAPLNWFGTYYRVIQRDFIDMENMLDLLNEIPDVIDAPDAEDLKIKEGQIDFKNVTFGYNPERVILKNISFSVPGGKTVALVGPSGSGKSTIIRLLVRFYDVDEGSILIDGQNLKTKTQTSVRREIGVVPQEVSLFNDSIEFNIAYGKPSEHRDVAQVVKAAEIADIHSRIETFPEGYKTQVGERGLRLSGGEKQRVGIARAVMKSPKIVLLDEATSALDTETERNIQAALHHICANRTTVIVAHRLSTIIHADQILVIKNGEIVERGKHEDLCKVVNGVYASMWDAQLSNNQMSSNEELNKTQLVQNGDNSL